MKNDSDIANFLADEIAARLNAVVPTSFDVEASGGAVRTSYQRSFVTQTELLGWISVTSDAEDIERAAVACLESVQQAIVRATTDPWPRTEAMRLAEANSRVRDESLELWFSLDGTSILELSAIPLRDFEQRR